MRQNEAADAIDRFIAEWNEQWPGIDVNHLATLGRILRISTHLRDAVNAWLGKLGLTWEMFDLLASLYRSGIPDGMRPTDLYEACLLSSGATTNRIDRAEQLGLVVRHPDPDDGRATRIALTKRGRAVTEKAMGEHFFHAKQIADRLTQHERETLTPILRKLLRSLEMKRTASKSDNGKNANKARLG